MLKACFEAKGEYWRYANVLFDLSRLRFTYFFTPLRRPDILFGNFAAGDN